MLDFDFFFFPFAIVDSDLFVSLSYLTHFFVIICITIGFGACINCICKL